MGRVGGFVDDFRLEAIDSAFVEEERICELLDLVLVFVVSATVGSVGCGGSSFAVPRFGSVADVAGFFVVRAIVVFEAAGGCFLVRNGRGMVMFNVIDGRWMGSG